MNVHNGGSFNIKTITDKIHESINTTADDLREIINTTADENLGFHRRL